MADRRGFLRGLVSLPLIGGGVTLIGAPSAPVPLVQAAAMPALGDPRQRAAYAWEAFSAAMREVTAGADGWIIIGAGERTTPLSRPYQLTGAFLRVGAIHYEVDDDPRLARPGIIERHREIALDLAGEVRS